MLIIEGLLIKQILNIRFETTIFLDEFYSHYLYLNLLKYIANKFRTEQYKS